MMRFVIVDDDKAAANALAKKLAAYDETELCGIAILTSSLKKHTFYNLLINNILYLCVT